MKYFLLLIVLISTYSVFSCGTVEAGEAITAYPDETIQLDGFTTANSFIWTSNDFTITGENTLTPTIEYNDFISGSFYITLTADFGDCIVSDSVLISVVGDIKIANVVTPNGDGINDVWEIRGSSSFTEATYLVYDLNGSIVYEKFGVYSDPTKWDGTKRNKGKILPAGSYIYRIDFGVDNIQSYQGVITLLY